MRTMRSASRYGSARISAASTTLKIDVFAPMPSASVMVAMSAKPGARISRRAERRRSFARRLTCSDLNKQHANSDAVVALGVERKSRYSSVRRGDVLSHVRAYFGHDIGH